LQMNLICKALRLLGGRLLGAPHPLHGLRLTPPWWLCSCASCLPGALSTIYPQRLAACYNICTQTYVLFRACAAICSDEVNYHAFCRREETE